MKKVICAILALTITLLTGISAGAQSLTGAEDTHELRVETNPLMMDGAHADKIHIPYGDNCTLTIDDDVEGFVFWNLYGDYEIIAGDYQEKSFTIRPLSDIIAVATYEEAMPHKAVDASSVSPQTGQRPTPILIASILIALSLSVVCFAIKRGAR